MSLALERDSSFAEAVALKSVLASLLYWYYYERSDSVVAAADEFSRKSLELAPGLAEGHWARGHFYYRTQLDYDRATEQVEQALRTRPGEADIVGLAGDILRRKGDMGGALARYKQAFELAPRDGSAATMIGQTLGLMREYSEGAMALRRAIELDPGSRTAHYQLARNRVLAEGDTAALRDAGSAKGIARPSAWPCAGWEPAVAAGLPLSFWARAARSSSLATDCARRASSASAPRACSVSTRLRTTATSLSLAATSPRSASAPPSAAPSCGSTSWCSRQAGLLV